MITRAGKNCGHIAFQPLIFELELKPGTILNILLVNKDRQCKLPRVPFFEKREVKIYSEMEMEQRGFGYEFAWSPMKVFNVH